MITKRSLHKIITDEFASQGLSSGQRLLLLIPQTSISCADDSLSTIGYLQLAKNIRGIVAYRVWAQYQASSNLRIAVALCHQVKDLTLTFRQLRKGLQRYGGSRSREKVDQ